MKKLFTTIIHRLLLASTIISFPCAKLFAEDKSLTVNVDWNKIVFVSKTTATLQVVENPMVRPGSAIHQKAFGALKELGADYVRYVPWFPYPKLAVAALKPPTKTETFWDFTYLDSTMEAFMNATSGHPVVINFSTTPAWMWKTDAVVDYPEDADEVFWDYNQGTALRDPTMKELAGYYARVFSWYTQGGFTDELGKFHKSNHFYKIPYWEVLNEPDLEHGISAEMYTKMYDAIVGEIKNISPSTKFIGIALGLNARPDYFEYFLNPKNHQPGIPLDGISYHFYASPSYVSQSLEEYQYTFFEQEKAFLEKVRFIESIRKRLSPSTITMVNEIGTIIQARSGNEIPKEYWNLSGALFADIYLKLMKRRIDVVGQSQLVGYPSMFPDVSMMDSTTGNPNARYWVLKLLKENFNPGDKLAATALENTSAVKYVVPTAQAFITATGRKILLVNKHNSEIRIALPADSKGKTVSYVDVETGENPPAQMQLTEAAIVLKPFAVAVVHMD